MTYYIKIRKSKPRKRKAKFWESDVIERKNGKRRIVKMKNEKNADEKRYINERREKLCEFDNFL